MKWRLTKHIFHIIKSPIFILNTHRIKEAFFSCPLGTPFYIGRRTDERFFSFFSFICQFSRNTVMYINFSQIFSVNFFGFPDFFIHSDLLWKILTFPDLFWLRVLVDIKCRILSAFLPRPHPGHSVVIFQKGSTHVESAINYPASLLHSRQ